MKATLLMMACFRAVLFWTELKLRLNHMSSTEGFRAVLFWTELKLMKATLLMMACFRAVLFWTELKL